MPGTTVGGSREAAEEGVCRRRGRWMQANVEDDYFEVAELAAWHTLLQFYKGETTDEESLR